MNHEGEDEDIVIPVGLGQPGAAQRPQPVSRSKPVLCRAFVRVRGARNGLKRRLAAWAVMVKHADGKRLGLGAEGAATSPAPPARLANAPCHGTLARVTIGRYRHLALGVLRRMGHPNNHPTPTLPASRTALRVAHAAFRVFRTSLQTRLGKLPSRRRRRDRGGGAGGAAAAAQPALRPLRRAGTPHRRPVSTASNGWAQLLLHPTVYIRISAGEYMYALGCLYAVPLGECILARTDH
jgi:hypothetical protein